MGLVLSKKGFQKQLLTDKWGQCQVVLAEWLKASTQIQVSYLSIWIDSKLVCMDSS